MSRSRSRSPRRVEKTKEEREEAAKRAAIDELTRDQRTVFVNQLTMKVLVWRSRVSFSLGNTECSLLLPLWDEFHCLGAVDAPCPYRKCLELGLPESDPVCHASILSNPLVISFSQHTPVTSLNAPRDCVLYGVALSMLGAKGVCLTRS